MREGSWKYIIKQVNPLFNGYSNPVELTKFYYGRKVGLGIIEFLKDLKYPHFFDLYRPYDEGDLQEMLGGENPRYLFVADDFTLIDNFISAFKQAFNVDKINIGRNGISNTMLNMLGDENNPYIVQIHEELEDFFPPEHFADFVEYVKKIRLEGN